MKYTLLLSFLLISACASTGRGPAQSTSELVSLNTSEGCNRIDAISSATGGRWRSGSSFPWDEQMISTLQSSGTITQVKMVTDDEGREKRMTLNLGKAGAAVASQITRTTYYSRYDLETVDGRPGSLIVSYDVKDNVPPTQKSVKKAKAIILTLGSVSADADTVDCKHANTVSEISSTGCTFIDEQTALSAQSAPLCFDPTQALNSYQNSF